MINKELAHERGLTKGEVKKLEALHFAMTALVVLHNKRYLHICPMSKKGAKVLRKHVRHLEYTMQEIWGFDPDKEKHTHWCRFHDLVRLDMHRHHVKSGKMSPSPGYPIWTATNEKGTTSSP